MNKLKPTSPGQRGTIIADYSLLSKKKPEKSLVFGRKRRVGRAKSGEITVRHKGGGNKRKYRVIDFKQNKLDVPANIASLEYDPNRSAFIALMVYKDGDKRYILATKGMNVGDGVIVSREAPLQDGNRMPIQNIPVGFFVHSIELQPNKGAQIARSAGAYAKITAHEGKYTHIAMPSGEIRKILFECFATIGVISNSEHSLIKLGKAGRSRWLGIRPTVRGSAMNPVDHPHGGGEGRQPIGMPYPKTPWGKHALGKKTRKKKKVTNVFILQRRKKKKKK